MKNNLIFLFDLDSTITKKEILPEIAKMIDSEEDMKKLTEESMQGKIPFKDNFLKRVDILKKIKVSDVAKKIEHIPLNENMVEFIKKNKDRCYIVTGNLDVWIYLLLKKIDMVDHCICSQTIVSCDNLVEVVSVVDKEKVASQFVQPFVSIGDGNNDAQMAMLSKIGVGFGGVRPIAPALLANIDYAFYDEKKLSEFLWKLVKEEK